MSEPKTQATLYYDGGCPVCAREIAMYRRQVGGDKLCWIDVAQVDAGPTPSSLAAADLGDGVTREAALAQLHLRYPDGRWVRGAAAFVGLWLLLPRWAWLGRIFSSPFGMRCLDAAYRGFLVIRPLWRRPGVSS